MSDEREPGGNVDLEPSHGWEATLLEASATLHSCTEVHRWAVCRVHAGCRLFGQLPAVSTQPIASDASRWNSCQLSKSSLSRMMPAVGTAAGVEPGASNHLEASL
eukprot:364647-Chlamydomonas_euryale.AAC.22